MKNDKEFILCSAIWYKELKLVRPDVLEPRGFRPYNVDKGIVFAGLRHPNCLYQMVALTGLPDSKAGESIQGFLTSKHRFVNREEGAEIALAAGQITESLKRLHSEDLW